MYSNISNYSFQYSKKVVKKHRVNAPVCGRLRVFTLLYKIAQTIFNNFISHRKDYWYLPLLSRKCGKIQTQWSRLTTAMIGERYAGSRPRCAGPRPRVQFLCDTESSAIFCWSPLNGARTLRKCQVPLRTHVKMASAHSTAAYRDSGSALLSYF